MPQSIPRMPVHGHVGAHTRVVTFGSSLTSAGGEEGGFGSLYLSVTQMLNDVYHDCAYVHVPHHTAGVSLLRTASYLPFFPPPSAGPFLTFVPLPPPWKCLQLPPQQHAPRLREFSSTGLDAKHSHFWSDDTNTWIRERRAQQFTENMHGELASHRAAKEEIYFGDTPNVLRGRVASVSVIGTEWQS